MNALGLDAVHPLAWLVLNVLLQIVLIVLLGWVLTRTAMRHDPALRHGVWVCALLCVLASPLAAWGMDRAGITLIAIPFAGAEPADGAAAAVPEEPAAFAAARPTPSDLLYSLPPHSPNPAPDASIPSAPNPVLSSAAAPGEPTAADPARARPSRLAECLRASALAAGSLWAFGAELLLARLIYGCLVIHRLRRALTWSTPPWLEELRVEACRALGVERLPPIAFAPAAAGPLTMGVLRPVVVLPEDLVQRLDRRQLRDVLVHEFAHAVRRDTLVGLLQRLAAAVFWPHPLVHLLNRELGQAREELCDNFVLRQAEAPDYAETLVLIAEALVPRQPSAMVALLEHRGGLERRVAGLLDQQRKTTTRLPRVQAAAIATVFAAAVLLVAGTRLLRAEAHSPAPAPAEASAAEAVASSEATVLDLERFYPAKRFGPPPLAAFAGRHVIDGLPFEVGGQICLWGQTPASRGTKNPESIQGIRVGRTFDELHLVHHTHWPSVDGEAVAYLELNYADGTKSILPIRYGRQVLDWDYLPSYEQEVPSDPDTKVCFRHAPLQYKAPARFFKSRLVNPSPAKLVETLDVVSARHLSSYVLLAATVANRDPHRPATPPPPLDQPKWKFDSQLKVEVVDAVTRKPIEGALVEPSVDVIQQWVVGSPFYTSDEGRGTIRYPRETTSRVAFSVQKEGYEDTWKDWYGNYPEKCTVELSPVGAPGRGFMGALQRLLSGGAGARPAVAPPTPSAQPATPAAAVSPASVHVVARFRTRPRDNFSVIDADHDFVPVEIWRQFGAQPKWRVSKPGRTAVMDGDSTAMLIEPNFGVKFPGPSEGAFDAQVLLGLADPGRLPGGHTLQSLTIVEEAKLPDGDPNKNRWFGNADLRWEYRFDLKTKRLVGAEAHLLRPGGDVPILKVDRVEYSPIDPAVFTIKFPEETTWIGDPQKLPDNERYAQMSPQEMARAFFEACSKEDWPEAEKFCQYLNGEMKTYLGGLTVVSLGEPFRSPAYAGWYVPYEIKFKDGNVKQWKLAVRNDNPAKRYVVDGGL